MGTTAAIIDSTLMTDRASRDKIRREMDDALLRYRSRFCRSAFRYLGNAADAEDAAQDALWSAYKHLSEFRGQARISTWPSAIMINSARMQLRSRNARFSRQTGPAGWAACHGDAWPYTAADRMAYRARHHC